tara:strand:+ start:471 stop:785 length:315 start_codon:yes stop_codon:yes gene_type:complete
VDASPKNQKPKNAFLETAKEINLAHFLNHSIIIIMNQSTGQRKSRKETWYVVTRDGRRASPRDYWTVGEAQNHASSLIAALKSFKDPGYKNVVIMETQDPESIN